LIDDISIWDYALTLSEIQNSMINELTGNETGLVGYWNLDEGYGNIVYDSSTNGNDGTINGATWSSDVPDFGLFANFSADITSGQAPLEVNFTDTSFPADSIVFWEWDFENDGVIDSYEQNPTFIYVEPGVYDVSLTVSNDSIRLSDTEIKEDYITVYPDWECDPAEYSYNGSIFGTVNMEYDPVLNTDGILGCFVGDECRGIASLAEGNVIDYTEEHGYIVFLPVIYSNINNGEEVYFKYWDSNYVDGAVQTVWETIEFEANMSLGSVAEPFAFSVMPEEEAEINLNSGWNWISLNARSDDMGINIILNCLDENGIFIKNQTQSAMYYNGSGWYGSIEDMNLQTMYMINMT